MATQLQLRRGTTTEHSTFVGAVGEVTVDTTKDTLVVHDGATTAGFPLAKESTVTALDSAAVHKTGDETVSGTKTFSSNPVLSTGTANGVAYLNGSKVLTTGSALTFDGSMLTLASNGISTGASTIITLGASSYFKAGSTNGFTVNDSTDTYNYFRILNNGNAVFYPSGSEQMRLTSTGLGIGTSSPGSKLHISSSGTSTSFEITNSSGNAFATMFGTDFYLDNTAGGATIFRGASYTERMRLDSSGNLGLGVTPSAWVNHKILQVGAWASFGSFNGNLNAQMMNNGYWDGSAYRYIGSNAASYYSQTYGAHAWFTAPSGTAGDAISFTQAMTLDASGNLIVGGTGAIATAANRGNITVNGASNSILSFGIAGSYSGYLYSDSTGIELNTAGNNALKFSNAGGERMRIDSSGNVGIGTSVINCSLEIYRDTSSGGATAYPNIRLNNNNSVGYTGLYFFQGTSQKAGLEVKNDVSALTFSAGGSAERMRIDSSGNLLVGATSNPGGGFGGERLVVVSSGSGNSVLFRTDAGESVGTALSCARTSNGIQISFHQSGSYIGNISTNGTTTSYNTSSDYRLKENIQPMQNALATVAQLNPVTYTWKADGSDGQGFIAHELQAVVPDCVTGEKDAVDAEGNPVYQGIDTSFLVATLTKAIQELNEKVTQQAAEIAALKGA